MTARRKHISLTTKLAAALLTIVRPDEAGNLVPVIDPEDAKTMTAKEVIAVFQFDHTELHALGGSDHHSNLYPRPCPEHRTKSRKDTSAVAKVKRLTRKQEEFRARLLRKTDPTVEAAPRSQWPKRKLNPNRRADARRNTPNKRG